MKKIVLCLLLATASVGFAQFTAKDVFSSKSIVWYGLNFTEAKMAKLNAIGYKEPFYTLEEGVTDYVSNYLLPSKYY